MRAHRRIVLLVLAGLLAAWATACLPTTPPPPLMPTVDLPSDVDTLFGDAWSTGGGDTSNTDAVELGVRVRFSVAGSVYGVRFYKLPGTTGTHTGSLWSSTGERLATGTFTGETSDGWQLLVFDTPVEVAPATEYVASYYGSSFFVNQPWYYADDVVNTPITGIGGANGVYRYGDGSAKPEGVGSSANYGADVVFVPTPPEPGRDWWPVSGLTTESGQVVMGPGVALSELTFRGTSGGGLSMVVLTGDAPCDTTLTVHTGDAFRSNCPGDAVVNEGEPPYVLFSGEFDFTITGTSFVAYMAVPPAEYGGGSSLDGEFAFTLAAPTTTTTTTTVPTTTVPSAPVHWTESGYADLIPPLFIFLNLAAFTLGWLLGVR